VKPFWVVLEGDYAESLRYVIDAESVEDCERIIREHWHSYDWEIQAIFDVAPVRGAGFAQCPYTTAKFMTVTVGRNPVYLDGIACPKCGHKQSMPPISSAPCTVTCEACGFVGG
jgi:ribosomal protein S27E